MKNNLTEVAFKKIEPSHVDKRGTIVDILEKVPIKHVGFITFKKGAIRANHYHKKQTQYTYVLEGEIKLVTKHFQGGKKSIRITGPGDLVSIPSGFIHTYLATKKSSIIVLTNYPRGVKSFEEDTFRIKLV